MKNKLLRITEKDFLIANRRAAREEEISKHGKQIIFRNVKEKSKKVYDRNRMKKADYQKDDLPYLFKIGLGYFHIHVFVSIFLSRVLIKSYILFFHPFVFIFG